MSSTPSAEQDAPQSSPTDDHKAHHLTCHEHTDHKYARNIRNKAPEAFIAFMNGQASGINWISWTVHNAE